MPWLLKLHSTKLILFLASWGCRLRSRLFGKPSRFRGRLGKAHGPSSTALFASDCSPKVRDGVQLGLAKAAALWGNTDLGVLGHGHR